MTETEAILLDTEVPEDTISIFRSVGHLLSRYRSGKIPKCFKVIPWLPVWQQLLTATEPNHWTAEATYQATRIFACSHLDDKEVATFYRFILLPKVRNEIAETNKLNYNLCLALKTAANRPSAYCMGIILTLCESDSCTMREAIVLACFSAEFFIPELPASAALVYISSMEFSGPRSIFMQTLLRKQYNLPASVINNLYMHFLRYKDIEEGLPDLCQHCLIIFFDIYKAELSIQQQREMQCLLTNQVHK